MKPRHAITELRALKSSLQLATRGGEARLKSAPKNTTHYFSQGGWTFEVNGSATASDGSMTLAFSKGGYQEARGSGPSAPRPPSVLLFMLYYIKY